MREAYDAAYRFQAAGDFARADAQHKRFLVEALRHIANGKANTGDYAHAVPVYEEALSLAPTDLTLLMDYAGASLDAEDLAKATTLGQTAVNLDPATTTSEQKAKAHGVLGRALLFDNELKLAVEQFKAAFALQPNLENIYALAYATLGTEGTHAAAPIFARMFQGFGDTAVNHMKAGRAYVLSKLPEDAIREFKTALAKDNRLPGLHYSLGAAYLLSTQADSSKAVAEFLEELRLHPDDTFSYLQLGRVSMKAGDYPKAVMYLKQAVKLKPLDADSLIVLGQAYAGMDRDAEAINAFRKAIAATLDPSHNGYSIQEAHYSLGRLLIASGNKKDGEFETEIARELLNKKKQAAEAQYKGKTEANQALEVTHVPTQREVDELKVLLAQCGPLIAGSYNNLGVHAAMRGEFKEAYSYFGSAALWKPDLEGLDHNLGRAAFAAGEYAQAAAPLGRYLAANPSDAEARSMLAQIKAMQENKVGH